MAASLPNTQCQGNPTFDSPNDAFYVGDQIPGGIHGYICRTPPLGSNSCPRFRECCGNRPFHNITSPVPESDPFYPASCVSWCGADPESPDGPNELSDLFDCMTSDADGSFASCEIKCEWICQKDEIVIDTAIQMFTEWCPAMSYSEMTGAPETPTSTAAQSLASTTATESEVEASSTSVTGARSGSGSTSGARGSSTSGLPAQSTSAVSPRMRLSTSSFIVSTLALVTIPFDIGALR